MSPYSGLNKANYQSCMTVNFKNYGTATYLAGFSTVKGVQTYNEEGEWMDTDTQGRGRVDGYRHTRRRIDGVD